MPTIDSSELAARLSSLFDLILVPTQVTTDGGTWSAVRPLHPEEPNGFCIALSRTPRSVMSFFCPDRFAGALVRSMVAASEEARSTCVAHALAAVEQGLGITLVADGTPVSFAGGLPTEWERLEIECTRRIRSDVPSGLDDALLVASTCLSLALCLMPIEEHAIEEELGMFEGARSSVVVNQYERSPINRAACLSHFGYSCAVCGFDFAAHYGEVGSRYIEVHHLIPVSQMGGSYRVNPRKDLVPLCSNCHSMAHRRNPPLTIEELIGTYRR